MIILILLPSVIAAGAIGFCGGWLHALGDRG
jgi:hypothetical protein